METIEEPKTMTPIFIGRWTPMILFSLKEKPYRHGELRCRLGGVSQRMLTRTLRPSRIHRIGRETCNQIECCCCRRVLLDPFGKRNHCSASRYVPLGEAISQGCER